jgi:hypothetical protein
VPDISLKFRTKLLTSGYFSIATLFSIIKNMKNLFIASILFSCFGFTLFHHGWSNYDQEKPIDLTGKILDFSYENPHGMATIERKDGKSWKVVLAPPSRMTSRGLSKEMLKPGTKATVLGYPHREEEDEMRAERITIDGKTVELR